MKRVKPEFYQLSALEMAPVLLGKILCHKKGDTIIQGRISEIEIYYGYDDSASHASKNKTKRNAIMFEEGGYSYVYLCYGIHHLFNIVTGSKDHPEAILIRGIEKIKGPGKVCKHMHIDMQCNQMDLRNSEQLWLEEDDYAFEYVCSERIGIGYADEKDQKRLWRYQIKESR